MTTKRLQPIEVRPLAGAGAAAGKLGVVPLKPATLIGVAD